MRTNLVTNPSFEIDTAGWSVGAGIVSITQSAGAPASGTGRATVLGTTPGAASANWVRPNDVPVLAGQWVAASLRVRRSIGATLHASLRLEMVNGGTTIAQSAHNFTLTTAGALADPAAAKAAVFQVPVGATVARAVLWFGGSTAGGTPPDGFVANLDAVILATGATQAEAEATLVPYFDGSFPRTDDVEYGWEGPPHASASFEREWGPAVLSDGVASIVVPLLTDEHESPSRNRVHALLGDAAPDVTLRPMGARTGTLECYCPTRLDALALLNMHRPGGPFTLTGGGPDMGMRYTLAEGQGPRLRREMPFRRWVVTIPYQEVAT